MSAVALPPRPVDGHKGTFGTVLVVGGCDTSTSLMVGGPAFAALGALRSGAGRCILATPRSMLAEALTVAPSATGLPLDAEIEQAVSQLDASRAAVQSRVVGPGLGCSAWSEAVVASQLGLDGPPLVLDADGLNLLAARPAMLMEGSRSMILTPHPGEYARLADAFNLPAAGEDDASRRTAAAALAKRLGGVAVLKGRGTVASDGERTWTCEAGSVALATAGSGDVLAGLLAGLLAQVDEGMDLLATAILGTWLHAVAGERWASSHADRGLLAAELAEAVPGVIEGCRTGELEPPRCPS